LRIPSAHDALLLDAVGENDLAKIEAALADGADIHARNTHGERPIQYAGRHHRPKAILNLLK
jgi:hypothetical protein